MCMCVCVCVGGGGVATENLRRVGRPDVVAYVNKNSVTGSWPIIVEQN